MKRRTTGTILATSAMALVLLGGCSDDKDATDASDTTVTSLAGSGVDETIVAFCDSVAQADAYFQSLDGPPEQAKVDEIYAGLTDNAPDEVSDAVATVIEENDKLLAAGPEGNGPSDAFTAAYNEVGAWMADGCGWETLEATAADYKFTGVPESASAGKTVISLTNDGTEVHEMAILRINDGVTQSAEELLALPQEEAETMVSEAGGAFALPGETGYATADLEPGKYFVSCFVPQGMTPAAMEEMEMSGTEPEGQPHFMLGMTAEFTVE